ncbi:hypothetical protein GCM10011380_26430 [Sphingomonas metalli]|uniref:Pseudouridine synthase n=1 Tax=Sphingomonas metalli TaxID=1779358 RepID=A0A916T8F0_9SPHN|nr:pseudouridine synthase [Sphingomonas metalli]GGB35751.1 hypothetical protein GCM10011380_26430 [Sphingomonas metalli]
MTTDTSRPEGDRIAKLLARAGIASRREIERMIAEGRIARDGVTIDTPATVLRSLHGITVDGNPVAAPPPARLFVFHKPPGLLVTERDPRGRPTIYDRLPRDLPRLVPVGRLDLATEGLLLLTTDGGLKRQLELPATGVERTYRARAYGEVTQAMLESLIEGIEIDGVRYGSIDANLERRTGANVWIELTLTEGKNREVRRVLEYLGLQVSRLIRTRYGPFILGDLPVGEIGEVRQHELVAFRQTLTGRRPRGADLGETVAVAPRPRPEAIAPPAAAPAARAPARPHAPAGGAGQPHATSRPRSPQQPGPNATRPARPARAPDGERRRAGPSSGGSPAARDTAAPRPTRPGRTGDGERNARRPAPRKPGGGTPRRGR